MLTPIILVLGLMAATAVIAYWSDNLGKKLGKKRVTLFGLRPKQTATLITIGSSMPIMLFTLGALLYVHKPLSTALLHYDAERHRFDMAREESVRAREEAQQARADEKKALGDKEKAQADREKAQAEGKKARANTKIESRKAEAAGRKAEEEGRKAGAASRRAEEEGRKAEEARGSAREAEARGREANRRADAAREGEHNAKRGEQSAREREKGAVAAANRAQQAANRAQARLASTQAQLASKQAQLTLVTSQLTKRSAQLTKRSAMVLAQGKQLLAQGKEVISLSAQADSLKAQIDGLKTDLEQSRIALASANQELSSVRTALADSRTAPTLVDAGETLAETTIALRQSQSQVSAQIDDLLDKSRDRVRLIGGGKPSMSISLPLLPVAFADGSTQKIDEAAQKSILVRYLVSADVPVSVRVISARLHTISESKIEVQLRAVEVHAAFGRDDVLASAIIDGRDSDAKIFKQLYVDLADKGQSAAEKKGVQPPLSRDVRFYAPSTIERIFEALRSIQALRGPAQVRIVAASELSTASPLSVRFEVTPAPRASA